MHAAVKHVRAVAGPDGEEGGAEKGGRVKSPVRRGGDRVKEGGGQGKGDGAPALLIPATCP
jgi:hypothetical protein